MTTHVLQWSQRHNAMLVEPLALALSNNRAAYGDNRPTNYVPLLIGTLEQCQATADSIQRTLAARSAQKVEA